VFGFKSFLIVNIFIFPVLQIPARVPGAGFLLAMPSAGREVNKNLRLTDKNIYVNKYIYMFNKYFYIFVKSNEQHLLNATT
jgi:hypothetical protein